MAAPPQNSGPPPAYVEHQSAKVIKNDVNVHKDSIKLEVDEKHPDHHLVSFVFDARFDGSITIYYFAMEEKESGKFIPVFPEAHTPIKVPFQEGTGQRFCQPSRTGVDLRHYNMEGLGKPSADGVFPIVILAEVTSSSQAADQVPGKSSSEASQRAQITQAVIERKSDGSLEVKVIKQIVLVDGVRYEVRELYGIGSSSTQGFNDDDPGKECVICMTEPKDTAVMPCRHLCMCSDCAKELRLQSNKCPICRQPITELIEIKINSTDQH